MIPSLSTNALVKAEYMGGRLPWAWVFLCCETAAVLMRSEPMFRTRAAALRIGDSVMAGKCARQPLTGRSELNTKPGTNG